MTVLAAITLTVTIHETGHWLACRLYRLEPRLIVNRRKIAIAARPATSRQSVVIALYGPTASALLAVTAWTLDLTYLAALNAAIALLSLIPAAGLDGQHIFRRHTA